MGLFSGIGSFVRAAGRTLGRGVEKVGNYFGSETLRSVGRSIQDACTDRIASEKSYNKSEADIYTTDRLNEILLSFSEGYFQQAKVIEKECIQLVGEYYDKLIALVENAPTYTSYSVANLKALKKEKSKIAKTITGSINNPLAKRMSLDDGECLKILKMDSGTQKKLAMTEFTSKVINEALNNLLENIRETLNSQLEGIQDYFNNIMEEQEKVTCMLKSQLEKMVRDNEMEQNDKEKSCVMPLYLVNISDCVCDILK